MSSDLENADLAKSNSMPLSSSQQDSLQTTLTFPEDNELSLGSQSLGTELADRRGDDDGDNVADGAKLGPEAMEVEPTNSQEILESATQRQSGSDKLDKSCMCLEYLFLKLVSCCQLLEEE